MSERVYTETVKDLHDEGFELYVKVETLEGNYVSCKVTAVQLSRAVESVNRENKVKVVKRFGPKGHGVAHVLSIPEQEYL